MKPLIFHCQTLEQTRQLGHRLGQVLFPGAVLALHGPLGAGKTTLTQAVAEGLGLEDTRAVTSPTFVLLQEYQARLPIYHFDVYRLKSLQEFEDLGAWEVLKGSGVCLLEWAEKVAPLLPAERMDIYLEPEGEQGRKIALAATGAVYETLLHQLERKAPMLLARELESNP
ncbi:MAG TPA: tRNA (adenosine(37)-N6)-threonylcarbamoyltransferase complex ATPase subunit type 1 TsaE [Gemmatales bacterium]|nr:tRNA (adenosine(37)-N6)-threonylcarbamoyltransferase complex ATPase subunit type 1 TsaE [Gemmatales bacterium]